jgi:hypothetical protein
MKPPSVQTHNIRILEQDAKFSDSSAKIAAIAPLRTAIALVNIIMMTKI